MEARRDLDHGKALDLIVHLQAIEAIKRHAALGALAHLSHILLHLAQRIELAAEHLVAVIATQDTHLAGTTDHTPPRTWADGASPA